MGDTHFSGVDTTSVKIGGVKITAEVTDINKLAGSGAVVASGTPAEAIADPAGGTTVDTEARAAIAAIIDALQAFGIVVTPE